MLVAIDGYVLYMTDVADYGLVCGKAVRTINSVIAVGYAVPAEVKVEQAVAVVAIANESVCA